MMDGIINLDKPAGITSRQAVDRIRRLLGIKKIGHGGTLDPDATGVLPICIGKATKLFDRLQIGMKSYEATFTIGLRTDTFDASGKIVETSDTSEISSDQIDKVFQQFNGEIEQTVPLFSAIKVNGQPLYKLARQGIVPEKLPRRKVKIEKIEILRLELPEIFVKIDCSKGTYIRSLAEDVGLRLKCGAILSTLRRTSSSVFTIENSHKLLELEKDRLVANDAIIPLDNVINILNSEA